MMAEKANPPSGSPAGSPILMSVVREEIPLSRREGEEVMKRRLSADLPTQKIENPGQNHKFPRILLPFPGH